MEREYHVAAFSPDALIGEARGLDVVLEAVVLRRSGVLICLSAGGSELRDRLGAAHKEQFAAWIEETRAARERGEETSPPPEQPAVALNDLPLRICDDIGTDYVRVGSSYGGTGTEWEATSRFRPAVPAGAGVLTIAAAGDADDARACRLELY